MKKPILLACLFSATFFIACDGGSGSGQSGTQTEDTLAAAENPATEQKKITLSPEKDSPEFPDAILEQNAPTDGQKLKNPVKFEYNVKNYELTKMTDSEHAQMMANSNKGQHIHLILNNSPYDAVYETTYEKELEPGNYVELSFLSRSFHMSLKHPEAYVLRQFTVGDAAKEEKVDLNAPHMFYSRPKGTYKGPQEANNVMLDFYLVNTDLSENGNKVRATINGEEFMITEWKPYVINGLPMGESTIKLELLDNNDQLVKSPYNPVTRTITLEEGDQPAM